MIDTLVVKQGMVRGLLPSGVGERLELGGERHA